jgi:hypothetical protein
MKYTWPWYLSYASTTVVSFFDPMIEDIFQGLRPLPVLESCAGAMAVASSLKYVPKNLCAYDGMMPFTLSASTATGYLSSDYPHWAISGTMTIGVSELSPQEFMEDLQSLISHEPDVFHNKSQRWHSQLAEALIRLNDDAEVLSSMRETCLIPLQDGTWAHAAGQSIFFSKGNSTLVIPSGVSVLLTDTAADSDTHRRRLYALLGVTTWEASDICRTILDLHASHDFCPASLSREQLISHSKFMYEASWRPPRGSSMYFATAQDGRSTGLKLYIFANGGHDSLMSRISALSRDKFLVIHEDYLKAETADDLFSSWLVDNFRLSRVPRLVAPLVEPKPHPARRPETIPSLSMGAVVLPTISATSLQRSSVSQSAAFDTEIDSSDTSPTPPRRNSKSSLDYTSRAEEELHNMKQNYGYNRRSSEMRVGNPTQKLVSRRKRRRRGVDVKDPEHYKVSDSYTYGDPESDYYGEPDPQNKKLGPYHDKRPDPNYHRPGSLYPGRSGYYAPQYGTPKIKWHDGSRTSRDSSFRYPYRNIDRSEVSPKRSSSSMGDLNKPAFVLSEEFEFLFLHCDSSEILQLLRDEWYYYSQWIDGSHMAWQDPEFLVACNQLKARLADFSVQSAKGQLPLRELVLPTADADLDDRCSLPSIRISNPRHTGWNFLQVFGVVVEPNVHYYLRCLTAIAEEQHSDADNVVYIYEKLQSHWRGNSDVIRYAS